MATSVQELKNFEQIKTRSSRKLRRWYTVHKWTSLISTLFILIACITGLPLVLHHEIDQIESWIKGDTSHQTALNIKPLSIDVLVQNAKHERPNAELLLIFKEPSDPDVINFAMGETIDTPLMEAEFLTFNIASGSFIDSMRVDNTVMGILYIIHAELYAGFAGALFLGLMTLLLLISLISGVILYAPFIRNRAFAVIRRGKTSKTRWLDLHNSLGMVLLVWALVVCSTGMINTVGSPMIQFWLLNDLKGYIEQDLHVNLAANAELTSLHAAIDLGANAIPDSELAFIAFPGSELSSDRHYLVFFHGKTPISSRLIKPAVINAHSGQLIATPELPWYLNTLLLSQPLHFGDYGGLGLKIVWVLLDIATIILLWSGLLIWWRKRNVIPKVDFVAK